MVQMIASQQSFWFDTYHWELLLCNTNTITVGEGVSGVRSNTLLIWEKVMCQSPHDAHSIIPTQFDEFSFPCNILQKNSIPGVLLESEWYKYSLKWMDSCKKFKRISWVTGRKFRVTKRKGIVHETLEEKIPSCSSFYIFRILFPFLNDTHHTFFHHVVHSCNPSSPHSLLWILEISLPLVRIKIS